MTQTGSVRTGPARSGTAARGRSWLGQGMPRRILVGTLGVLILALLWELYIFFGPTDGVVVGGLTVLPRASEMAMPHLWVMLERILEPVTGVDPKLIYTNLQWTSSIDKGDLALPTASLRIKGAKYDQLAKEWSEKVRSPPPVASPRAHSLLTGMPRSSPKMTPSTKSPSPAAST